MKNGSTVTGIGQSKSNPSHQRIVGPAARFSPGAAITGVGAALLAAGAALAALGGASEELISILAIMWKWMPLMFEGFLFNILVSVLAMAIGTASGAVLGLAQVSPFWPLHRLASLVTQFFRNAPWLVLLFYCIFLLPFEATIIGVTVPLPGWIKATIGLSLPVMANVSEIVRGAVQSVPAGQWESAEALAFSRRQTMWMIILPQCLKRMLPPWMNLYAILTMATPLISIVGVEDAMTVTRQALAAEGRTELLIPMYSLLLGWFFLYCYPIARWTQALERRFNVTI